MQGVREEGKAPEVKIGTSAETRSTGQEKNLLPFRYRKTPDQQVVPELSDVPGRLLRCIDSKPAASPVSIGNHVRREMGEIRRAGMTPEDQKLFYEMIKTTRENAIITLETLSRYDEAFSMRQAELLQSVASIIFNAEVIEP